MPASPRPAQEASRTLEDRWEDGPREGRCLPQDHTAKLVVKSALMGLGLERGLVSQQSEEPLPGPVGYSLLFSWVGGPEL